MFRKPKRKAAASKASLRGNDDKSDDDGGDGGGKSTTRFAKRNNDDGRSSEDDSEDETGELLSEARKRLKGNAGVGYGSQKKDPTASASAAGGGGAIMHAFEATEDAAGVSASELATSVAEHHSLASVSASKRTDGGDGGNNGNNKAGKGEDGIFRDKSRNKFLAGPIRAAQHVRVTARFDYQPDVCKDYKETGFCGFGDTCIYLHDRGDTMSGWQIEQQWEEQQKQKREQQERELQDFVDRQQSGGGGADGKASAAAAAASDADGIPFACHICRSHFTDPVVTTCQHYFCEKVRLVESYFASRGKNVRRTFL